MYYTYILISELYGRYYYGHTANLEKRISEHNKGKVRSTKSRRPWKLHYFETYETKSEAAKREYFFKSIDGYKWLKKQKIT
jgi:putative endonuclease